MSFFQLTFPNKAKTEIAEASVCKEIAYRFMYSSNGGSAKYDLSNPITQSITLIIMFNAGSVYFSLSNTPALIPL